MAEGTIRRILPRVALPAAMVGILILQVVLVVYFEPPGILLSREPASRGDLDTHLEQTWRVTEALDGWGKSWAYDPQLLAGYPNGTIFDADNKGWELWTYALWKMGVPRGLAFNLFILLAHLLVPWVTMLAARQFRLGWWASVGAAVLAMACWYFDIFPHRCWWIGMVSYGMVGYLFLLPLALMYRFTEDGGWWRAGVMAATMAAGHLIHPYIFMMLVAPMLALYIRAARRLTAVQHVALVGAALATIAANAYWLLVAIRFWHYVQDSGFFGSSTVSYLLTDYLGLMQDPEVTGYVANRTGFRVLAMGAAVVTLVLWRKKRDGRFLPFVVGLGLMLAVTYLGGYFWLTRQVQPYRHILPAIYISVIPAAALLEEMFRSNLLRDFSRGAAILVALLAVLAVPHLARDVLYFVPDLLPEVQGMEAGKVKVEDRLGIRNVAPIRRKDLRRGRPLAGFTQIADWVVNNDDGQGRILVEWGFLGEHLAWKTSAQIIGGFIKRNMVHARANLFREHLDGNLPDEKLREYLERYAVKWIIVSHRKPALEKRKHILQPIFWSPPHVVYEPDTKVSYFQQGSGSVRTSMNRIELNGTPPDEDLVLRFHWLETLVCTPDCTIEREPLDQNPVGFIRVKAPHPQDMVIENGY